MKPVAPLFGTALRVTLLGTLGLTLLLSNACTRSGPSNADGSAALSLKKGARPLAFNHEQIHELFVIKNDPSTGDAWSARVTRPDLGSPQWLIGSSGSAGTSVSPALVDREADGTMILHLLDTLRTLEVVEPAPPTPIDVTGLNPPRFALQWRWQDKPFELRVGARDPKSGAYYAQFPASTATQFTLDDSAPAPIFLVRGATLAMLDYLKTFDSVRLKTWVGLPADQVDEISVRRGGREVFYAQREGTQWTRRDHRPVQGIDVGERLEAISHLRIKSFIDEPEEAQRLGRGIDHPARDVDVILTERGGRARTLTASLINKKLFAKNSAREGAVFEIHDDSLRFFTIPGK